MDDKLLLTFKTVAEEKSFTQAAEKLYVSHTAVIKQINRIEERLEVKLFNRDKRGVTLTAAGQVFYEESLQLMKAIERAVERIRAAHCAETKTLRVGTSLLFPCYSFMDLWVEIRDRCAEYPLKIISFDDDTEHFPRIGEDYDFVIGIYNPRRYDNAFAFLPVGKYRFCIAVPRTHVLAKKKQLTFEELDGYPLMLRRIGSSPINNLIHEKIGRHHPGINLVDVDYEYNASIFNHAVERNCPLLSLECWDRVNPDMKSIPLAEGFELPYGIIYTRTPSENLKGFLSIVETLVHYEQS
ncbi:MAG: LysR family transcriptional regulator [Ruminococcaceae bacterium]|nr:LysR family transcriptional regulator [Oscillospiraceae bacterium]